MPEQKKNKPDYKEDLFNLFHQLYNPALDGKNPHFKNEYSTLEGTLKHIKPMLKDNNFIISQQVKIKEQPNESQYEQHAVLQTFLIHISGESLSDDGIPLVYQNPNDPQKLGGSITYARRYGMCAILGIVGDKDDDGSYASNSKNYEKESETLLTAYQSAIASADSDKMLKDLNDSFSADIGKLKPDDKKAFNSSFIKRRKEINQSTNQ